MGDCFVAWFRQVSGAIHLWEGYRTDARPRGAQAAICDARSELRRRRTDDNDENGDENAQITAEYATCRNDEASGLHNHTHAAAFLPLDNI